jgi:hypothetical protein
MNLRCLLAGLLLTHTTPALSQLSDPITYRLLDGSTLTDDCPVCDRLAIVVPLTGTFTMRPATESPLFAEFEITDISFGGTNVGGASYLVSGIGTYRVGGEVALIEQMYLEVDIAHSSGVTKALCVSPAQVATQEWGTLQIPLSQTNGSFTQVFTLDLIAAPLPQLTSIFIEPSTGDIRLTWVATPEMLQLERSFELGSGFSPLGSATSNTSYVDPGAATNYSRLFYRLRQVNPP